jgi:hypothetical protein
MQVYFDMDGVLADLDGALAAEASISVNEVRNDRSLRRQLIDDRRTRLGTEHYTTLEPMKADEFRSLFRELAGNDIGVHILTAADVLKASDVTTVYMGKHLWLRKYYGDLLDDRTISGIHIVTNGEEKARQQGRPGSILVDDEVMNTIYWRGTGGDVIDYQDENHEACVRALRSMVYD